MQIKEALPSVLALKFGTKPLKMRAYCKSKGMIEPSSLDNWFATCAASGINPIENRKKAGELLIFMLYIGKDRDGKDMYEGDIIEVDYKTDMGVILLKGIMEWNPDLLQFGTNVLTKIDSIPRRVSESRELPRVIGNIFTNPELLKEFAK